MKYITICYHNYTKEEGEEKRKIVKKQPKEKEKIKE